MTLRAGRRQRPIGVTPFPLRLHRMERGDCSVLSRMWSIRSVPNYSFIRVAAGPRRRPLARPAVAALPAVKAVAVQQLGFREERVARSAGGAFRRLGTAGLHLLSVQSERVKSEPDTMPDRCSGAAGRTTTDTRLRERRDLVPELARPKSKEV
jgi:hypothetical protein